MSYDFGDYGNGGGYFGEPSFEGTGGGFQKSSGSSPDKKGKEQSFQTVTPLTIKMILDAPQNPSDDSIMVDNKQVNKVVVCGRVLSTTSKHTYTDFALDDGTAAMHIVKFASDNEDPSTSQFIPEGSYVVVHGAIRTVEGERKVSSHSVRVVTDHNEITHHYMSAIFNHYQNVKGSLNNGSKFNGGGAGSFSGGGGFGATGGFATSSSASFNNPHGAVDIPGVDIDAKLVHDVFASDTSTDEGLTVAIVADRLKSKGFNLAKVKNICQTLMQDGYIYSTIDDDHYKSTGSFI